MADGRHAGQTTHTVLTWTEQAPDVVEVLVMMTYDKMTLSDESYFITSHCHDDL